VPCADGAAPVSRARQAPVRRYANRLPGTGAVVMTGAFRPPRAGVAGDRREPAIGDAPEGRAPIRAPQISRAGAPGGRAVDQTTRISR
jgi:hypothetical protein